MNTLRVMETRSLDELAVLANREHEQVWRAGRSALEHAVRCGVALLEAQTQVEHGGWLAWLRTNIKVHPTSAYRYMRLARFSEKVLASDVEGVEQGLRLIAEEPWCDRSRLSEDDKIEMTRLARTHSLDEIADVFGVARSTVWRWTSPASPASLALNSASPRPVGAAGPAGFEITDEVIERVAAWLCSRFAVFGYPAAVNDVVRSDALELLQALLGIV